MAERQFPTSEEFAPKIVYDEVREFATEDKRIGVDDLSVDQLDVLKKLIVRADSSEEVSLGGYAGSGKSTLIPLLAEALGRIERTAFCCFTGKAANVLKRKLAAAGIQEADTGYVGTIHGLMYQPAIDERGIVTNWNKRKYLMTRNETQVNRIIVDEASMVGKELLDDLKSYGIPIVLVGDHGQLEPVQDVSILSRPDFRLEKIHRQAEKNPIIRLANEVRKHGDIPRNWKESEEIRFITNADMGDIATEGFDRLGMEMGILVRSNKVRCSINKTAVSGSVPRKDDIVICLRNNPPIFNGMRGIVKEVETVFDHWYRLTVHFPDDGFTLTSLVNKHQFNATQTIRSVYDLQKKKRYPRQVSDMGLLFDFGMALTVHKAQGSAFEETILCPEYWPSIDDGNDGYKRWLYTGITRAAKKLYIMRR